MGRISKPHDKFFKETLSDLETAKDFMQNYLPQDVLKEIDLESLSLGKDSYIDKEMESLFSDLLFEDKNSRERGIYILFI